MNDKLHTYIVCSKCNGKGKLRDLLKLPPNDIIECNTCDGIGSRKCLEWIQPNTREVMSNDK